MSVIPHVIMVYVFLSYQELQILKSVYSYGGFNVSLRDTNCKEIYLNECFRTCVYPDVSSVEIKGIESDHDTL